MEIVMTQHPVLRTGVRTLFLVFTVGALALTAGCDVTTDDSASSSSSSNSSSSSDTYSGSGVSVSIAYPDTLTGGSVTGTTALTRTIAHLGGRAEAGCFYQGNPNWWVNGYNMTQFLIGTSATWTCIAESLITLAALLPLPNGVIIDISDATDPDSPTGIRYSKDGEINVFEFFFDGNTVDSDVWTAWVESDVGSGTEVEGRLVLSDRMLSGGADPTDLIGLRVDFYIGSSLETAGLFVAFADTTDLIGFRADVAHDLSGTFPAFTAKGIVELREQWDTDFVAAGITTTPDLRIITYASDDGEGATIGRFVDAGLSLNDGTSDYGLYLFSKDDIYYFAADGSSEFINKSIDAASYVGERSISTTSLDYVEALLGLGAPYFDTFCYDETATDDASDCTAFVQSLFQYVDPDGNTLFGMEPNSGTVPADSRFDLINGVTDGDYLDSALPVDVFAQTFTPSI